MEIYIYSRGLSKGYSWVRVHEENKVHLKEEKPPHLDLDQFSNIIDMNDFSVVVYRHFDEITLLVTGLESSRTDNRVRTIHTSVAWVGQENEESKLRKIAVEALESYSKNKESTKKELSKFEKRVDEAISSDSSSDRLGFKVSNNTYFKSLKNFDSSDLGENDPDSTDYYFGNLSYLKNELIDELKKNALPNYDNILVLVSPTVTETNLKKNVRWRGLSDEVNSDDGWRKINSFNKENNVVKNVQQVKGKAKEFKKFISKLNPKQIIILLLVVSLSGNAFLYFQNNSNKSKIETLQSKIEQLKDKNQNLENQNQELKDKNQNLENQNQELQDKMNELRDTLQD